MNLDGAFRRVCAGYVAPPERTPGAVPVGSNGFVQGRSK